jgi:hypothetical protein
MAVCSPSSGAIGVFSGTSHGSKARVEGPPGNRRVHAGQEDSPAHDTEPTDVLVSDARGIAVEAGGAHSERAEQAVEGACVAFDQRPVLDPPQPVDEEDPRGVRGGRGPPIGSLHRHVHAGRRLVGFVPLDGGVEVGGERVEAKGIGGAHHHPRSLARSRGMGGPAPGFSTLFDAREAVFG